MSQVEWYYARDNKQMGPVSSLELKRLAAAGQLRPENLVWREGMTEWSLAGNVRGLFDGESKPADSGLKIGEPAAASPPPAAAPAANPAPAMARRHLFDLLLDWLRSHFDAQFIDSTAKKFRVCGSYGLLAAIGLAAVFAIIASVKTSQPEYLLRGLGMILALAIMQYVAGKSCEALERLRETAGGSISSTVVPNCVAVLSLAGGMATLLLAIVSTIVSTANLVRVPLGAAAFVAGGFLAVVALNPAALGILIAPVSRASDETLGVLTFLLKALMRSVPVIFGAGAICVALLLAYACGEIFSGEKGLDLAVNTWWVASLSFWWFAALPPVAYLAFLAGCLLIDIWRAILSLPDRRE